MAILRCTEPFAYWNTQGHPISIAAGDLVDAKDPAVKGRERWFETVETTVERSTAPAKPFTAAPVEQATASPGEKRPTRKATKAVN